MLIQAFEHRFNVNSRTLPVIAFAEIVCVNRGEQQSRREHLQIAWRIFTGISRSTAGERERERERAGASELASMNGQQRSEAGRSEGVPGRKLDGSIRAENHRRVQGEMEEHE